MLKASVFKFNRRGHPIVPEGQGPWSHVVIGDEAGRAVVAMPLRKYVNRLNAGEAFWFVVCPGDYPGEKDYVKVCLIHQKATTYAKKGDWEAFIPVNWLFMMLGETTPETWEAMIARIAEVFGTQFRGAVWLNGTDWRPMLAQSYEIGPVTGSTEDYVMP